MKIILFALAGSICSVHSLSAATVRALFTAQNQSGSPEAVTGPIGTVSASTFPVAPSLNRSGSSSTNVGGEADYTDFNGRLWLGSGSQETGGHSFGWNGGGTGLSMTLTLNLTSIYDLTVRMGIRSAATNGAVPATAFTAIEYSVNNGAFVTAASGSALNFTSGSTFSEYNLDLTALAAIENRSNVRIRFSMPDLAADTNLRIDNVLITGDMIPEPSSAVLFSACAGLLFIRRR